MADYLGVPVLDVTEPDRAAGTEDEFDRKFYEINSQTGVREVHVPGPADSLVRQFEWVCFSRAEAKVLRDFIAARYGRAVPFWLRSWERDLTLVQDYAANDPSIKVREVGYRTSVFPLGPYRRHLSVRANSGTFYQRRATAVSVVDTATDAVTLETPIAEAITVPGLVCFLRYSRLEEDEPKIRWGGGHYARCALAVREIPRETPP